MQNSTRHYFIHSVFNYKRLKIPKGQSKRDNYSVDLNLTHTFRQTKWTFFLETKIFWSFIFTNISWNKLEIIWYIIYHDSTSESELQTTWCKETVIAQLYSKHVPWTFMLHDVLKRSWYTEINFSNVKIKWICFYLICIFISFEAHYD